MSPEKSTLSWLTCRPPAAPVPAAGWPGACANGFMLPAGPAMSPAVFEETGMVTLRFGCPFAAAPSTEPGAAEPEAGAGAS